MFNKETVLAEVVKQKALGMFIVSHNKKDMATATKKAAPKKRTAAKKTATKRSPAKKAAPKKTAAKKTAAKKGTAKKNKLGVKNSLANNINAKKKAGTAKSKKKSTVSKKAYKDMENNWGKDK